MRKRLIYTLLLLFLLLLNACNIKFDRALKSKDLSYIISKGDDFFTQKKYSQSIKFYKHAVSLARETQNIKNLIYKIAMANFQKKKYSLSARQFKKFYSTYPKDKRAEKAFFYSAYSFYLSSLDYNLDQSDTYTAIEALRSFISEYPESEKIIEAEDLIHKLTEKLEKKIFEIAKIYHDIMRYKASVKAFEQFIDDFPQSLLVEKAEYYKIDAQYELAICSVKSIEKQRLEEVLTMIKSFISSYPNSPYSEKIIKIEKKVSQNLKQLNQISVSKK